MRRFVVAVVAVAAATVVVVPAASAGGMWIVAQNAPPTGIAAGDVWNARLSAWSCLGKAQDGLAAGVAVREQATGRELRFPARRVRPGVYQAQVVFPSAGTWTYATVSRDLRFKTYGPVRVASNAQQPSYAAFAGGGGLTLLAVGGAAALLARRRR